MPKVKVPCLCSRSQPGIKVIIRELRGHLLHTVTFLVLGSDKPRMLFFPLINVKMPTIVGILTFTSWKIFMLS